MLRGLRGLRILDSLIGVLWICFLSLIMRGVVLLGISSFYLVAEEKGGDCKGERVSRVHEGIYKGLKNCCHKLRNASCYAYNAT